MKALWESVVMDLGEENYDTELVHLIGKVNLLSGHRVLGVSVSGVGSGPK